MPVVACGRTLTRVALMALALGVPSVSGADCRAKDFNVARMQTVIAGIDQATAILVALRKAIATEAGDAESKRVLEEAVEITDRTSAEGNLFAGYVAIYNRLVNDTDRRIVNDVIRDMAKIVRDDAKGAFPAVHSRHFGVLGQPVIGQYQGFCQGK